MGSRLPPVGAGMRELRPEASIYAAEPHTAAPLARSFVAGEARTFDEWTSSFVDGAGGRSVLKSMWPLLETFVEDSIVVSLDDAARAMKLVAERVHVIMEGAAACAVAAARSPEFAARKHKKVVAIVSGGNIDLSRFAQLTGSCASAPIT